MGVEEGGGEAKKKGMGARDGGGWRKGEEEGDGGGWRRGEEERDGGSGGKAKKKKGWELWDGTYKHSAYKITSALQSTVLFVRWPFY